MKPPTNPMTITGDALGCVGSAAGGVDATVPEARNRKRAMHKGRVMLAPTIQGPLSIIAKQLISVYWRGRRKLCQPREERDGREKQNEALFADLVGLQRVEICYTEKPGAVPKRPKGEVCKTSIRGFESHPRLQFVPVRPGDMGNLGVRPLILKQRFAKHEPIFAVRSSVTCTGN